MEWLFKSQKQRKESYRVLKDIAELTDWKEASEYEKYLLQYARKYGYDKYIQLLKEIKNEIQIGMRKNNDMVTIAKTACIKVL